MHPLQLQAHQFGTDPAASVAVNEIPVVAPLILAREVTGELVEPVKFNIDGVLGKAVHYVLAHQHYSCRCDGEDREQDGGEQAMANGDFQSMPGGTNKLGV